MQVIEQIASVVPYGESVLHKAEGVYGYSKGKTLDVYKTTKDKVIETKKGYFEFRKNVELAISNIARQTVNEVLSRSENFVGVVNEKRTVQNCQQVRERLQTIFETVMREYVLKSRLITNKRVQALIKVGHKYSVQYAVPMYISLRATLIVAKEMLIEFLESCLHQMKVTYESSKDNVVMFISGNFSEEKLKSKVFEGISSFKEFTVKTVNKGLQIKVDRQSLVENYDKFALNLLQMVKQVREKGEGNIEQVKKKSRDIYKQAMERIRAKELQIKTNMKQSMPQLFSTSASSLENCD